jgi:protocatechuate 3,4-dioxygenase beta subunit
MKALATALGGVLTMKTMAGLLAAVALAVTLTWIARERAAEPLAAAAPAAAELARAPGDREPRALADAAPPAAEPRRAVADAAPPSLPIAPAELEVRVTFAADGAPAPDVGVYLRVAEGDARGDEQRTDAAGVTTFASLAPEVYEVHVDRVSTPARVRWPEASRVALAIPAGLRVEGRVVDLEDEGVAGAAVFRQNARHHDLLQRVAVTGAEGRFTLRDVEDDLELLARASRHQPSELETVRGTEVAEVELRLGARGHALGGRVLLPDGWPAAHAWVLAGVDEDAREEREGSDADPLRENRRKPLDREGILLRADADGRFASDEIPGGHVLLVARTAPGEGEDAALVGWTTQFVRGDMADELVVRLQPGASVAGRVRDRSGAPVAGVALEAEWEGTRELGQMEDDLGPFVSDRRAVSAQDGSYRLAGLLPGDYDLRVRGASEELAREERVLGLGEVVAWDPVIDAPGALDVHLAGPIGAPLAGWRVEASDRAVPGRTYADSARLRTDAEGRVRVPDLPAERDVTLAFFAPRGEGNAPLAAATRPGARPRREAEVEEVRVRLAPDEMPTASLVGRFRGSDGQPAERARIELRNPGSDEEWVAYTEPDGRFAFRPLAPGPVRLRAVTPELPAGHTLGTWTLATGEALDVGDLVAPSTAPFTVIVRAADGGSVGRLDLELLPLESPEGEAWARDALVGGWSREGDVFTALAPIGPAFLRASGGEFAAWYEPVHVGAGGPVDVRLERAAATTLRVRLADERETEALALRVRLWDERGLLVLDHEVWTFGRSRSHAIEVPLRVRPGSYRLRVDRRGSDERVERELLLPLAGTAQAIDVELR